VLARRRHYPLRADPNTAGGGYLATGLTVTIFSKKFREKLARQILM
jgi:hypothetical protein